MSIQMISIIDQFSENPAGRYVSDGPNSGERFRNELLVPALKTAEKVKVNLDGVLGYGSSFLEEAFGGLVRLGFTLQELRNRMEIVSSLETYKQRVWRYIEEEAMRKKQKNSRHVVA